MKAVSLSQKRFARLSDRTKAVGAFFVTSVASRMVSIVCQFIQVPIAVKALGAEAFGLWMTLTSISVVIGFSDFGMGQGAQNKLGEAFASGDVGLARELWNNALIFLTAIWGVMTVLVLIVPHFLDFAALFSLTEAGMQSEARRVAVLSLLLFCFNIPLGLSQILAYSRQKGWMQNAAQAAGAVGALIGVLVSTQMHCSLTVIIVAAQAPFLAASAVLLLLQLSQLGWLDIRGISCRWSIMRELIRLGKYFGVQQVQVILMLSLPSLMISTTLGASAVTPFNLAQRLFNIFAIVQNAFMQPLWPAYSNAKARGDWRWMRRMLRLSLLATLGCSIAPMAVGAIFAREVIERWVGAREVLPSAGLVWALFLWNASMFVEQPFGFFLAGISEVRRLTFYMIVSAFISPPLMYLLLGYYGPAGGMLGMCIGFLPTLFFGNIFEVLRVFRGRANPSQERPAPLNEPVVAEGNR